LRRIATPDAGSNDSSLEVPVSSTEGEWATSLTRRRALAALAGIFATAPTTVSAQLDPRDFRQHRRVPALDEMTDVFDFEPVCFANVPLHLYNYMARATDSEWTMRRNRLVFDRVDLVDRPGVEPASVDASTEILGVRMEHPILIAPNSNHGHMHPTAESGTYQAATAAGTLMGVAHGPTHPHEQIAEAATGPRWIQLYPSQNLQTTRQNLERFQAVGARAIIITVDQQATQFDRAAHGRWLGGNPPPPPGGGVGGGSGDPQPRRTSLTGPPRYRLAVPGRLWYTWDYMESLREFVNVPVLIKGILTPEDARICVQRGFDGVIVSNHGARSLDYAPSTLEVLPEIVNAVGGQIPVLIDSGFRRGSDVFKALALGADAACVGRATRWGLGAFGPAGVQRVLEILQAELRDSMARTGRRTLAEIDRSAVTTDFA
jgi:4-hydroxymandelate oxidase